jgi:hypothetical protein
VKNDKIFAAYALILVGGCASVITASVMAGFATLPTFAVFLEHIALSLAFRAAYKSIGGFDWVIFLGPDSYTYEPREAPTEDPAHPAGAAAVLS